MTDILKRATAISSILSGIYSGVGFIVIMKVKNHDNLETAHWNQFVGMPSVIFFLLRSLGSNTPPLAAGLLIQETKEEC